MAASHQALTNWYLQLAQHLDAGIAVADALELSGGPSAQGRKHMAEAIRNGLPWAEVIETAENWLPKADRRLLIAAQDTARLPQTCQRLSERHRRIKETHRAVILSLIYPIGVFHLAAFVLPFMQQLDFETGLDSIDPATILSQGLMLIAPVWVIAGLIGLMVKAESPVLPGILRCIPLLRRYTKAQALADFSSTLGSFAEAGTSIQIAWREAAAVSRSRDLQRINRDLSGVFERGENPADSLDNFKAFPMDFVAYYRTGASTGKLDSSMLKIASEYQGRANRALASAAIVYPSLLFAAVAGMVVYTLLKFYAGYFDMLNNFF